MKVAPEIVARLCTERAPDLLSFMQRSDLVSVSPVKLLWAIAGVESNFGMYSNPRHEQGYCYNGRYYDIDRTIAWGCLAHCSFGPWQVMFDHFPQTISPIELLPQGDGLTAAELSIRAAIGVLNQSLARGARSLGELVVAYNGPADSEFYARKLYACFERPMPQVASPVVA